MICRNCGAYNANDAPECRKCGQVIPMPWWRKQYGSRPLESIVLASLVLLLLVTIISNLLEARGNKIRYERARIMGDTRSLAIAMESYYLDYHDYPAWSLKKDENAFGGLSGMNPELEKIPTFRMKNGTQLATLTTPASYVSSYFRDPFAPVKGATFGYWTNVDKDTTATGFIIWSAGPDGMYDITMDNVAEAYNPRHNVPSPALIALTYDPSNGSHSTGDVYRVKQ